MKNAKLNKLILTSQIVMTIGITYACILLKGTTNYMVWLSANISCVNSLHSHCDEYVFSLIYLFRCALVEVVLCLLALTLALVRSCAFAFFSFLSRVVLEFFLMPMLVVVVVYGFQ